MHDAAVTDFRKFECTVHVLQHISRRGTKLELQTAKIVQIWRKYKINTRLKLNRQVIILN